MTWYSFLWFPLISLPVNCLALSRLSQIRQPSMGMHYIPRRYQKRPFIKARSWETRTIFQLNALESAKTNMHIALFTVYNDVFRYVCSLQLLVKGWRYSYFLRFDNLGLVEDLALMRRPYISSRSSTTGDNATLGRELRRILVTLCTGKVEGGYGNWNYAPKHP